MDVVFGRKHVYIAFSNGLFSVSVPSEGWSRRNKSHRLRLWAQSVPPLILVSQLFHGKIHKLWQKDVSCGEGSVPKIHCEQAFWPLFW